MTVKLAIVGSREYTDYKSLCMYVKEWKKENKIKMIDLIVVDVRELIL